MRRLIWLSLLSLILAPFALAALLLTSLSEHPLAGHAVDLGPERLMRAQRILDANDPRKLRSGEVKTVQLGEDDLDLAANYLAQRFAHGAARLTLDDNAIHLALSVALPPPLAGRFLNGEADLAPTDTGLAHFTRLKLGHLPIPGGLADILAQRVLAYFNGEQASAELAKAVKRVAIGTDKLTLTYEWQTDLPARLSGAILPEADLERLGVYRERLVALGTQARKDVSLTDLLKPLFILAGERSAGGDPVAENRAAIVALTFYVTHHGLDKIVPNAAPWPQAAMRHVKLQGRDDFPKHFILSAAIAVTADTPLANAIGLFKEVKDSRGGSGFSFNDIAADRAGTRLGEMASTSPDAARYLQQRMNAGLREEDILPKTQDLPEFMPEAEFKRRFGGIGEPRYVRMMNDIETRIAALPLYQR